ncbi:Zn2Cys6 transcriptional regulator [Trichoderma guizhouense]|uniref:Zn2Cys6 transcriptional regulator n=1 Tax=Trichoderma guizhouense TaxID=1491466 RepID=A0A1T3CZJ0_9HYPO|nr:Zn2Cys6 transcriptional regulator [Trichoderma guizhouense]
MKKSIACGACRTSKRRCIHSGGPPCIRCKERGDECIFPPKGTSFIFRRSRLERQARAQSSALPTDTNITASLLSASAGPPRGNAEDADEQPKVNLWEIDPLDYVTDEVKESYLRCSYKWSFHHMPTFFASIRNKTLDRSVAWAMLAITVRFSQHPPDGFSSQIQTSNYFAAHTRSLILPSIDEPSLQRIQVLLMLTGHSWGSGEGRRAWVYLGMAVRMAQIMGLFEDPPVTTLDREDFIHGEERRRTAWTCFLMDSLLSGGKGRERLLSADSMHIQLPCDTGNFIFGEPVICPYIEGYRSDGNSMIPPGNLGIVAHSMGVADIWGAVAKWSCSSHPNNTPPWQPQSELQRLLLRLNAWRESLPPRLRYDLSLLHAHSVQNQGQAFCYMHCIYFMSVIFLYRSYLPELEMHEEAEHEDGDRKQWTEFSCRELAKVADQVCEMLQDIRGFGLFFLRGLVPWIGFTIYTAVGTLLYFWHFPHVSEGDPQIESWRQRIIDGCVFLKDMRQAWPMADTWRETIKAMHIFYSNVKSKGNQSMSPSARREMRNAIIDYGALQPSPVQAADSASEEETLVVSEQDETNQNEISTNDTEISPNEPEMSTNETELISHEFGVVPPADYDLFDTHFDIDSTMAASFADATQGFWEGYPGNHVDMGWEVTP